jgi:octaprenyl-diphosphate synthase
VKSLKPLYLIQKFDNQLSKIIKEDLPILKEIKSFIITSGGKRIRPLLHHFLSQMYGYSGKNWLDVGAVAELIHAASLLHDDVVDKAPVRRGKTTIHTIHGNKVAILGGDYLLACGIEHLNSIHQPEILNRFTKVLLDLSVGELIQMEWERNPKINQEIYTKIIYGKTGSLFQCISESAAILAGKDSKFIQSAGLFGKRLGIYFQMRDDYIDYFPFGDDPGKEMYKDFYNGLYTLPILKLRESLTSSEKSDLLNIMKKELRTESDQTRIDSLFLKYETKQVIKGMLLTELSFFKKYLSQFPDSDAKIRIGEQLEKLLIL